MSHIMLICTVGGSPDPLVKSLLHWRPEWVLFIPSPQTKTLIDTILLKYAEQSGHPLSPGCYRIRPVPDAENLAACLQVIRAQDQEVHEWLQRGGEYQVVADFTAGTKCMSVALGLQARRWRCLFSYVSGASRSKGGVGVVETGSEYVVHSDNPWDMLGYQAVEDACLLFDQHAFSAAVQILKRARKAAEKPALKRALSTFIQFCEAYDLWDRFQHQDAFGRLESVEKNRADLAELLGVENAIRLTSETTRHKQFLTQLLDGRGPSQILILDLLSNAKRRAQEGRFDDAVARLYRAIEAMAQIRLRERYEIAATDRVPLEFVPASLRIKWETRANEGVLRLIRANQIFC